MEQNNWKEKLKEFIKQHKKLVSIIGIAVVFFALGCLVYYVYTQYQLDKNEKTYEKIRQEQKEEKTITSPMHDYEGLKAINPDVYGWITVPGTNVDYPLLQSEEDNYYLYHSIEKDYGYPGSVYSNKCNNLEVSDYINILYGHNAKTGAMFGSLNNFYDQTFFEEHDKIYVETPFALKTYEIYGAFNYNDDYLPAKFEVKHIQGGEAFVKALKACAKEGDELTHVRESAEPAPTDQLIVLSTCIKRQGDRRYLVVGKLVEQLNYEVEEVEVTVTEEDVIQQKK